MNRNTINLAISLLVSSIVAMTISGCKSDDSSNNEYATQPEPEGLYALWYSNRENPEQYLTQPYITGGQMVFQWKNIEPEKGKYDFSEIAKELKKYKDLELFTTIQINGNLKPDYLYEEVPYHTNKFSIQIKDDKGSLMFWHPTHKKAYLDMLKAFAAFIENNEGGQYLLGIRQNFNGFGTEHLHVPEGDIDLNEWVIPKNTDPSIELKEWSLQIMEDYQEFVIDNYIDLFAEDVNVFVRNTISPELEKKYRDAFESGKLSWFHTSSEVEPRNGAGEIKYKRFIKDCRSGKTVAYAEPWASAWGHHGGKTDDRWCSPPQWFYWTQLNNLNCGVSYIGIYSTDMRVAIEGIYESTGVHFVDDEEHNYQEQFQAMLDFAAEYAGKHDDPQHSPGAWVAFRENHMVLAVNGMSEEARKLETLTGDYSFLMERISDNSYGQGITNVGPDNQRFGAWARVLPAGKEMKLRVDQAFLQSCKDETLTVLLTYYDAKGKSMDVVMNGTSNPVNCEGEDQWKTKSFEIDNLKADEEQAHIIIKSGDEDCFLHMVEIRR